MKNLFAAVLYLALGLTAIPVTAMDLSETMALRDGDMKKLIFREEPKDVTDAAFQLEDGQGEASLQDYQGKWVLLNFWATWCAPCRHEMPMLAELQAEFGGEHFEVLTLATGRNSPQGIIRFFEEEEIENLPRHQDPKQAVASQMAIFGLPITVLINPDGQEVARLRGDADWSSESAKAIIRSLLPQS